MKKSALKVMASALFATFIFTGAASYGAQNQDEPFVSSNLVGDVDYAELLTDQYSKDYQLKRYRGGAEAAPLSMPLYRGGSKTDPLSMSLYHDEGSRRDRASFIR